METRFRDEDPISPTSIEHKCEELFVGDALEQRYNFIVYHFECDGTYCWARSYLDEIHTVSIFGPFASRVEKQPVQGPIAPAVLAYLRRRFRKIEMLQAGGYAPV